MKSGFYTPKMKDCRICGKSSMFRSANQKYCGNPAIKDSCSYKGKLRQQKKTQERLRLEKKEAKETKIALALAEKELADVQKEMKLYKYPLWDSFYDEDEREERRKDELYRAVLTFIDVESILFRRHLEKQMLASWK